MGTHTLEKRAIFAHPKWHPFNSELSSVSPGRERKNIFCCSHFPGKQEQSWSFKSQLRNLLIPAWRPLRNRQRESWRRDIAALAESPAPGCRAGKVQLPCQVLELLDVRGARDKMSLSQTSAQIKGRSLPAFRPRVLQQQRGRLHGGLLGTCSWNSAENQRS